MRASTVVTTQEVGALLVLGIVTVALVCVIAVVADFFAGVIADREGGDQ